MERFYRGMHIVEGFKDTFVTMLLGRHVCVTPKLIANLLGMMQRGLKLRVVRDEEYVDISVDYKVPTDYKFGELVASMFSKKGK